MNQAENGNSVKIGEFSMRDLILKIREWWHYMLSKWVIIVCAGIVGASIGLIYSFIKKPVYQAQLSFALEDEKSSGGGLSAAMGLASQFGIDLGSSGGGGAFSGDNLLGLMRSRSMVENTLLTTVTIKGAQQTLAEHYINFNKLRAAWENKPALKDIHFLPSADRAKFSLAQDSILGVFYKRIIADNLSVDKIDKKLSIITVQVNSVDEQFSKDFTEILVKTVSDFYIATKTKRSAQNVTVLQRQTDSVRRELNSAITGVASYADINPNPNPSLQVLRVPSQRRQVDVQANTAILTQLVANLELSKITLRKETPLIQIIDRPILPLDKERFGKLKGILLGGFASVFLIIIILVVRRAFALLII